MTPRTRAHVALLALAAAVGLLTAVPVRAQDVRVEIPSEVIREIERAAEHSARAAVDSVSDVLRSLGDLDVRLELTAPAGAPAQDRTMRAERVDRSERTIAVGPSGLVELHNVSGDIVVTAGSGRDVVLEIVRRSRGRSEADAALGLQQVQVTVEHRGERARVATVYPRGRTPFNVSTDYTLTAPAGSRIAARSVSGNVTVRGITGDVSVEVVSGNVTVSDGARVSQARSISGEVRLTDVQTDGTVASGTVSGDIHLRNIRARRLTAENVSGDVRAEGVTCDTASLKSLSGTVEYTGPLARNGRYEFDSHSGTVRVVATGGVGFELQARTFSGRIRPEGLTLQAVDMNRGQLRTTVGDGSAVVIANTFSGDVVIARR